MDTSYTQCMLKMKHQKSVFIRLKKGFTWKIFCFEPDNFDEYMESFATVNSIKIEKA